MHNKNAVIIFLKSPEYGKVKTRLAKSTNRNFALRIYIELLKVTLNTVSNLKDVDLYFYGTNQNCHNIINDVVNREFFFAVQKGNNLGEKMANAFNEVFEKGNERVLIVGTDVPDISSIQIKSAFKTLEKRDVVLYPSNDGGYSLLGMNGYYPELFNNIEWSTERVLSDTLKKINRKRWSYELKEILMDIDNFEDLQLWITNSDNPKLISQIRKIAFEEKVTLIK